MNPIRVAHDPTCPWCLIGLRQTKRLTEEFGVTFEWFGYELFPEELPWPEPSAPEPQPENKPRTPSRFQLAAAADDLEVPRIQRPSRMRIHLTLEAMEHAKEHGYFEPFNDDIYHGYWYEGDEISDQNYLLALAQKHGADRDSLEQALNDRIYRDRIVKFDDQAYAEGVYNVPTFWIGGERYAEQPYRALADAIRRAQE